MIDFTAGAARETIAPVDVEALRAAGALIEDTRRERPRYFDGRFLAARDLIRDQQYFLAREADLGQASGGGVAAGLRVARGTGADELVLERGHGLTPAGELTMLPQNLTVRLADIPLAEQLSMRFALSRRPQPPLRNRTGLFLLALRPVEFTANPIGAYPSSITGQRTVEDGDVIEATAVVLVPWTEDNATDALEARRGRAARAIFVENRPNGASANVLPLAMMALQNNTVVWLDVAMVRRELGADRADQPGIGVGSRALRLAHLLQYRGQLDDELSRNANRGFPAASRFPALPPTGPMPPGVIATGDFTQNYFPAEIDAELAPIPEDELPALIDEALALPAIDLTVAGELLESTSVMILAPVPRNQWRAVVARLQQGSADLPTRRLLPAAANRLAARKPLEILQRLRLPRLAPVAVDSSDPREREWARLATLGNLWFVRRRNLAYSDSLPGAAVRFAGSEGTVIDRTRMRLDASGLKPQFDAVIERAEPGAAGEVGALLSNPRIAASPTLTAVALGELKRATKLDRASVLAISQRVAAPGVGEGLVRLENSRSELVQTPDALARIVEDKDWRKADDEARIADVAAVPKLAATLAGATPTETKTSRPVSPAPVKKRRPK